MIRLTEIKLPLDHDENAIGQAIINKLKIQPEQLHSYNVFKRGYDARKKTAILLIYTLDIEVDNETELLATFAKDQHVKTAPDTSYKFVAQANKNITERPVVIGFGPCGLFAGLVLAQMGFNPIIVESLDKFNARKYWSDAVNTYNAIPFIGQKINTDLDDYVTNQALSGLFDMVAKEELNIRKNVSARSTDLLQKVFAKQDNK